MLNDRSQAISSTSLQIFIVALASSTLPWPLILILTLKGSPKNDATNNGDTDIVMMAHDPSFQLWFPGDSQQASIHILHVTSRGCHGILILCTHVCFFSHIKEAGHDFLVYLPQAWHAWFELEDHTIHQEPHWTSVTQYVHTAFKGYGYHFNYILSHHPN